MKARFIAVLLSFVIVTLPAHAVSSSQRIAEPQTSNSTKIDLNHAELATLTGSFKGIGKKRAEAIIAYRETHQGFKSLEELAEVRGFGQRFVENNRDKLKEVFEIN